MNIKALGLAFVVGVSTLPVLAAPAFAWTPSGCTENPLPPWAVTQGGKDYCRGVAAGNKPVITNTNTNNNTQAQQQVQGQKQKQQQHQTQSQTAEANNVNAVNNRLNNSLANLGNSYNSIHVGAQLPMVNAPDCGGVNIGGTVGYDEEFSGAISVATHVGRRSDSCTYHPAIPVPPAVVYVQPTTPVSVAVAAPAAPVAVTRTVYVTHNACAPDLTRSSDLAYLHAHRSQMHRRYRDISPEMKAVARRLCIPNDAFVGLDG